MGFNPPVSQGSEIPGNVGPKEFLPLEGKGEPVCGLCLPCMNGGGLVPLFGVRPILWLASPCRQVSLYPPAKSSLGPQQQEHHLAPLGGQTRDRTEAPGMMLLHRRL